MKSIAFGIFSLVSVILFTFTLAFIFTGSAGVEYSRVAMAGDRTTAEVLEEHRKKYDTQAEDVEVIDMGAGDMSAAGMAAAGGGGDNTVVWINIPGFRNDYIERSSAAFLGKISDEGGSTGKMRPNFPPVTYSGHITMATGVTPGIHGIPSDRFRVGDEVVDKPTDASLLLSEPIWQTATRQGLPTLVHDWPLSQNQSGPNAAAYFLSSFDETATDEQRLDRLWNAWIGHQGEKKLRLLMCRLDDILKAGLENGPQSDETYEAVKKTDEILEGFVNKVTAAWPNLRGTKDGNLVFMITTDHGLVAVDKNVNLEALLGPKLMKNLDVAAHDAVAHLYFKDLPESEAEANLVKEQIEGELKKMIIFRTYAPDDFPSAWNYVSGEGRIGDRVLVLKTGFAFCDHKAEEPIFDPSEGPGFYGGYGYPVTDSIRMSGQVVVWGYPEQVSFGDLGEFDQTAFHASVCELLKIERAEKASDKAMSLR